VERDEGYIRIRGILVPVDWDGEGNIMRAAIMAPNEEEYLVESYKGEEYLQGLMQEEVEALGMVRDEGGRKIIRVAPDQLRKRGHRDGLPDSATRKDTGGAEHGRSS
jgi:hypothetical protein